MKLSTTTIFILFLFATLFAIDSIAGIKFSKRSREKSLETRLRRIFKSVLLEEDDQVKTTEPLSDEVLIQLLDNFPNVENDAICLKSEKCAEKWMINYNYLYAKINEKNSFIEFQFETNITEENEKLLENFSPIPNRFMFLTLPVARKFLQNSHLWSPELRRMLFIASQGIYIKNNQDIQKLSSASNRLETIYAMAQVCDKTGNNTTCFSLDPDLYEIMANSRDYDKLLWAWKGWHDATGKKMKTIYAETVELNNKAARENGYADLSERWLEDFEEENFEAVMDNLYEQIKPLYQHLHAYVKRKLDAVYSSKYKKNHDPNLIQAHLLGNMWAQEWDGIYDLVKPYPDEPSLDLTQKLVQKGYQALDLFKESERFFTSIGLYKMTPTFWKYSQILKPTDRAVQCHASATDFCNGFDFRIKMCTEVNEEVFSTVHHEMGHIEYYMAYSDQAPIFRAGANSGFHEAIGDTIALSVMSPKHLKKIDLIDAEKISAKQEINFLMKMALKKIAFLPFGYLIDKWRWNVFRGLINETNYNQKWWEMRKLYQGVEAPVLRTENDFDPGAKYHVASYTPYARYFVSHLHEFQFYKALCKLANHEGELNNCDFFESREAGLNLKKMLEMGNSKHWKYALNQLTGETTLNSNALFEYFKPLSEWLEKDNSNAGVKIGW